LLLLVVHRWIVIAIVLSSASARADDSGFLGAGVVVGVDRFIHAAVTLEGGIKLPDVPLWVHAVAATGGAGDFEGGGPYKRLLGGIETRSCSSIYLCLSLDLDAGYQSVTWVGDTGDPDEHYKGMALAGRIGIDTGGEHVRFRAALEIITVHDRSNVTSPAWDSGAGLAIGLAYQM
jgi:hypothetical protein